MAEPTRVHPTRDDPVVALLSERIGGPAGSRAGRHWWWTPLRVVLAMTAVCFALGMVQKEACYDDGWTDGADRYTAMCYSDLPYLYTGRGLAELNWPYGEANAGRYDTMEYPVGISYFAWGTAWLTHGLAGAPDLDQRATRPADELAAQPDVAREVKLFVVVSALLLALVTLAAAYLLAGVNPGRPWDAMAFAASPALLLNGLINWDLLAVVLVAGALWAWSRDRPLLTGVLIGLGAATKLYPLFLLGALLVVCVRQRRGRDFGVAALAAVGSWQLANAPAWLTGPEQWKVFWSFNSERGADLGSLWLVWQQNGHTVTAGLANNVSWAFFGLVCVAVLVLGLRAPAAPRVAQLGFLIVAGFLLVNKVYSPQYVLWLLPLAVIARPRWRDLLIWQAGEVLYFAMVWFYLGGFLESPSGEQSPLYWLAILVRISCELYLIAVVVRDIWSPERDPVLRAVPGDLPAPSAGTSPQTHRNAPQVS